MLSLRHYSRLLELAEAGLEAGDVRSTELETARQNYRNATKHQIAVLTAKLNTQYQLMKDFAISDEHIGMIPETVPEGIGIDLKRGSSALSNSLRQATNSTPSTTPSSPTSVSRQKPSKSPKLPTGRWSILSQCQPRRHFLQLQ